MHDLDELKISSLVSFQLGTIRKAAQFGGYLDVVSAVAKLIFDIPQPTSARVIRNENRNQLLEYLMLCQIIIAQLILNLANAFRIEQ